MFWVLIRSASPICCWYSLEAPRQGASKEYPQHTFLWRMRKLSQNCHQIHFLYNPLHFMLLYSLQLQSYFHSLLFITYSGLFSFLITSLWEEGSGYLAGHLVICSGSVYFSLFILPHCIGGSLWSLVVAFPRSSSLTFTTDWANSADGKLKIFSRK